jgi:hypothetical protein
MEERISIPAGARDVLPPSPHPVATRGSFLRGKYESTKNNRKHLNCCKIGFFLER